MDKGYPTNSSISGHLNWLHVMGYDHGFGQMAKKASIGYHKRILDSLGWEKKEGDGVIEVMLRSDAISSLGLAGDKDALSRAKKEFDSFIRDGKEIDVDIRGALYVLNAWQGDAETFDFFLKRYKEAEAPDERRRNLRALGSFSDPALLGRALGLIDSKDVRLQDSFLLPDIISGNPIGRPLIWGWVRNHWKAFLKEYDSGTHMLGGFVEDLSFVSDRKTAGEIKAFFGRKANRRSDMEMSLRHTLERIQANLKLMEKNKS